MRTNLSYFKMRNAWCISWCPKGDEDDESEEDADYAPDARGASDAESSSESDGGSGDSDVGERQKNSKRSSEAVSAKKGPAKKQV